MRLAVRASEGRIEEEAFVSGQHVRWRLVKMLIPKRRIGARHSDEEEAVARVVEV